MVLHYHIDEFVDSDFCESALASVMVNIYVAPTVFISDEYFAI